MTNLEKVKNMNKGELAEFIDKLLEGFDDSVVSVWFNKNYCKSICEDIEVIYEGKNQLWKECYFEGNCPYQKDWGKDMVKLWLDAESEE